jgi:hypothetical protein
LPRIALWPLRAGAVILVRVPPRGTREDPSSFVLGGPFVVAVTGRAIRGGLDIDAEDAA